jgi:hypothetical protein
MAAIAASGVVYTAANTSKFGIKDDAGIRQQKLKMVFGNAADTYPSGGIPMSGLSAWGFPNKIAEVLIIDGVSGDGNTYKYDSVNNKMRIYRSAGFTPAGTNGAPAFTGAALGTHIHDIKAIGGLTSSEALFLDASQKFGKNAATDRTIVGSTSATTGGVVATDLGTPTGTVAAPVFTGTAVAAAALIEATTGFVPASNVTLYILVRGY